MKLCLLADARSIHSQRWARHLAGRGHDVHVFSFREAPICSDKVTIHKLKKILPYKAGYPTAIFQVRRLIAQIRPEVVHAHYATSYGLLGALSGFHPYVVSVWGSDVFDFPRKSAFHHKLLEFNLSRADHVCSTSRIMAEETRKYCHRPITVTPFGVDCDVFKPISVVRPDPTEFVVGTAKSLEPKYGIEYLLQSFALVFRKYRNKRKLRLVVAGEGSLREKLINLTKVLGIDGLTNFVGFVPHERVPEVLNTFSVFVAVSTRESFGVAVLEASACGIPVIVSNIGGLPEVVQDGVTGIIVPPRDVEATVAAISRFVEDGQARRDMGTAGREFVLKNYEWKENASRMEHLYQSILPQQ